MPFFYSHHVTFRKRETYKNTPNPCQSISINKRGEKGERRREIAPHCSRSFAMMKTTFSPLMYHGTSTEANKEEAGTPFFLSAFVMFPRKYSIAVGLSLSVHTWQRWCLICFSCLLYKGSFLRGASYRFLISSFSLLWAQKNHRPFVIFSFGSL